MKSPNSFEPLRFPRVMTAVGAYWMGHGGEGMSELYDKIKGDVRFRKEVAEKSGLGFELPNEFSSKIRVIGPKCLQVRDNNQDAAIGA